MPEPPQTPSVSVTIQTQTLESINSANLSNFEVKGQCSEEGQPVIVSVDSISPSTQPTCLNEAWLIQIDVTEVPRPSDSILITADHSSSEGVQAPQASATVISSFPCPDNFVAVPPLEGYTSQTFCVAKYEMKNDGNNKAVSQAAGSPYVRISRDNSIRKCEEIGEDYDLITNNEWQTMIRNMELVGKNWQGGVVGSSGGINAGHTDSNPSRVIPASSDDNEACAEKTPSCDRNTWRAGKRTHTLSNGEAVWDVSGNVNEWVKDESDESTQTEENSFVYIIRMARRYPVVKDRFGPSGDYNTSSPFGFFMGTVLLKHNLGTYFRGGAWGDYWRAGLFATSTTMRANDRNDSIGFRCVYRP